MKKIRILTAVLPVLLLTTFLTSGCGVILVPKDGETETEEIETRQYDFTEFTRVNIGSAFDYEIQQADTYSISITAGSNLFDDISVTKVGQALDIGIEFHGVPWTIFNFNPKLRAVITMPQLQGLDSSGSTQGTVTGFKSGENLDVTVSGASTIGLEDITAGDVIFDISGSSKITGDIDAKNMELEVSGASTVQLEGSTGNIAADVSGSSNLKLSGLELKNAYVTLSGASDATINLTGRLDADLSDASTLKYIGEPTLGIMRITGASTVKRK